MLLKKKIASGSLAEVVIALAVIALCFGVASLVFVRATKVATSFEDLRLQTEVQSALWEQLHTGRTAELPDGVQVTRENDPEEDSVLVEAFTGTSEQIIWQQQKIKDE